MNLGGHTLSGSLDGTGIAVAKGATATVWNGTIKEFGAGIAGVDGARLTVNKVSFTGTRVGINTVRSALTVVNSRFDRNQRGITAPSSTISITNTKMLNSEASGVQGIYSSITVSRSVFVGNGSAALMCGAGHLSARHNTFKSNDQGVYANDCGALTLANNTFLENGNAVQLLGLPDAPAAKVTANRLTGNSIAVDSGAPAVFTNNVFDKNGSSMSVTSTDSFTTMTGNRFTSSFNGLIVYGPGALKNNVAVNNSQTGIYAPNVTDLGGNRASGNGIDPQCTGVVCN